MTANEIRGGLQHDPFYTRVWRADSTNEWVIEWWTLEDEAVARAAFQESEDGIHWTRFYVREPFRRLGIYTRALRWSLDLDVPITANPDGTRVDMWDGFKESKEGPLKIDKRVAKARAKVR